MPANIAVWTTAMTSPASAHTMVKPRILWAPASTSAFMKPRVSDIVSDRNTAAIGSFATRTAMPWRRASPSLQPTRARGGGVGVGDPAGGAEPTTFGAIPAAQIGRDDAEIVERDVGELWAAGSL